MNTVFMSWLASNDMSHFDFLRKYGNLVVIKIEKDADFYYLFCQQNYGEDRISKDYRFEYAGLYCKRDGKVYDATGNMFELIGEEAKLTTADVLKEQLQQSVRERVESVIGDDKDNLKISELTDPHLLRQLEHAKKYSAASTARKEFLKLEGAELQVFQCGYSPADWTDASLQSYILDPAGYAEKEVEAYIDSHQEEMLYDFLFNDAVLKEYKAIQEDTDNSVHVVKRIILAMKDTPAKTVNVTILKAGQKFTFKTTSNYLRRDCTSSYPTWDIVAPDRKKFEKMFGRCDRYTPQEIIRITYGKKVLYEAEQ